MSKKLVDEAKKLGWDGFLFSKAGRFAGAVTQFEGTNGEMVAVGFNEDEAFTLSDELGLYTAKELLNSMKEIDYSHTSVINGVKLVAWLLTDEEGASTGEVEFVDSELDKYGILDFSVKEQIKKRILALSAANATKNAF